MSKYANLGLGLIASMALIGCSGGGDGGSNSASSIPVAPLIGQLDSSYNQTGVQQSNALSAANQGFASFNVYPNGNSLFIGSGAGAIDLSALNSSGISAAAPISFNCLTLVGFSCQVGASIVQFDGKTVVGFLASSLNQFQFVRFNTDGSLDTGFGTNGIASISGQMALVPASKMIQTSDQHLIALGQNSGGSVVVMELNTNGSLNTSFGSNGVKVVTLLTSASNMAINSATNDIYLFGISASGNSIVHISAAGVEDTSFGSSGIAFVASSVLSAASLAYDSVNHRLVSLTGTGMGYQVNAFDTAGHADNTFGTSGVFTASPASGILSFGAKSILLDTFGNIYVLGNLYNLMPFIQSSSAFELDRLTPAGAADASFATNGVLNGPSGGYMSMQTMQFAPNGELLLAGVATTYTQSCIMSLPPIPPATTGMCMFYGYTATAAYAAVAEVK